MRDLPFGAINRDTRRRWHEDEAGDVNPWVIVSGDVAQHGGMDCANLALARFLANAGYVVRLIAHHACAEIAEHPNVTVRRVWRPLGSHLLGRPMLALAGRAGARRLAPSGARILVNGGNCPCSDINWVHYVHAADSNDLDETHGWRSRVAIRHALWQERRILPECRVVICNSQRTRREVVERLGVPADRAHVVYYGCDPDQLAPVTPAERAAARQALGVHDQRPLAAFVGALGDRRKGFDTLLAAWKQLCCDRRWDADLMVVGDGGQLPTWRRAAVEGGIGRRIRFLGFRHDVPRILAACDVLVHPARYEAYGLGVHEALCRGLPAIVSGHAGVAERYPTQMRWLLLAKPNDVAELAQRLQTWQRVRQRTTRQMVDWSTALRSRTWDDMAAEIVNVVEGSEEGGCDRVTMHLSRTPKTSAIKSA